MNNKTIIIIDTESGFIERFKEKLSVQGIADKYQIHQIIPKTSLEPAQLVENCLNDVKGIIDKGEKVYGIFVDIVIFDRGSLDDTGIKIATKLKPHFPDIPIFNITAKFGGAEEIAMISEATLEDVDGVLIKDYLEGKYFSVIELNNIFNKAKIKRDKYKTDSIAHLVTTIPDSIKTAFNFSSLDSRVKYQIQKIGEGYFWNLLAKLLPNAEGVISFMQPGRSGAYVFKILVKFREEGKSPTRPKAWIIKIANKKELLKREVQNHTELKKTSLGRTYYPQLLTNKLIIIGNWAGIALELEEDANSLMDCFGKLTPDELKGVTGNIKDVLTAIYGDPSEKKIVMLWKEFYDFKEYGLIKVLSFLEEHKNILKEKIDEKHIKRISDFIKSNGATEESIINFQVEADTRTIHGDFNSRNILVNGNKNIVIIDFSERGQGHIAKDIAKLERDVIFRIFDAFSPNYYDWSRIGIWQHFLDLNKKGNIFSNTIQYSGDNAELKKSIDFILAIRGILKQLSPNLDEKEYLCVLLHYSLLVLAHPEISIQKKVFAIQYINQILENFD